MARVREAVVLAGGFGTRLAHVVPDVCKPMAPVAGRPFLHWVLCQLDATGFGHVVIADGYRREQIEEHFRGSFKGLRVDYSPEDEPLLTGGAVKRALRLCAGERVFVVNGDTFFDVDFAAMEAAAAAHPGACAVIAAKRMERFERYGTLDVDDGGAIRRFVEKRPCEAGLINGGVYLLGRGALEGQPDVFSLEEGYFLPLAGTGALVACEADGAFIDIGVPDDYARAQGMFADGGAPCRLALFDRDGTINVDTGHLHRAEDLRLIEPTVELMRRYSQDPQWRVAVVTNQAGIAKGLYGPDEMWALHRHMEGLLAGRGVRVDGWYFCPHHPDFTGPCDCRKPAPGMLLRALRDFGAEPARSVMHGDAETDRAAAEAAGVDFRWAGEGIESDGR